MQKHINEEEEFKLICRNSLGETHRLDLMIETLSRCIHYVNFWKLYILFTIINYRRFHRDLHRIYQEGITATIAYANLTDALDQFNNFPGF